jgi:N-acetyldiaminopimelate deacetylase
MGTPIDTFAGLRRRLHQIPEPGFQEYKTQKLLLDYLSGLPQDRLEIRTWRTGVLVKVKGTDPKRTFGYRADMDGLPIEEETSYEFRSVHPGFMHACGHDMHMAIGLGIVTRFAEQPMADDLVVIFQPAEEGPGGAQPMLESAELQDWMPDQIAALHIAPEYEVGTIAVRPGILFADTSELFIDLVGKGGHAAYPHKANDMVVASAHLLVQLQSIVSRSVDPLHSAVITVGKIESGVRQNVIAEKARLEGTIRTLSAETMDSVKKRIEAVVRGIETSFECKAAIDYGALYRQVYNDERLTSEFMDWLRAAGTANLRECDAAMTGEDFGYFLEKIPGFMFWLGVESDYGLHHAKIEPDERAIPVALDTVEGYFRWKSESLRTAGRESS